MYIIFAVYARIRLRRPHRMELR